MKADHLSKEKRKKLIKKISEVSGIAQYALEVKMTDEQVLEAANNLAVFTLIKSASNYNRHCQRTKTAEANAKLKQFLDLDNSEIYRTGQWLFNALAKKGNERKNALLEKDLVHKENYNEAVVNMADTIKEQKQCTQEITSEAEEIIKSLEEKIDYLKKDLVTIQTYIINNYSLKTWQQIARYIQNNTKAS
jgi:bacterioferritin (cytochrome b1)